MDVKKGKGEKSEEIRWRTPKKWDWKAAEQTSSEGRQRQPNYQKVGSGRRVNKPQEGEGKDSQTILGEERR